MANSNTALKAGSKEDFSNSMAEAMMEALWIEWPKFLKGTEPPKDGDLRYMKLMFSAIAQGVVKHLVERLPQSMELEVTVMQNSPLMSSDGVTTSPQNFHNHPVQVTQNSDSNDDEYNKIVSFGTPTVTKVGHEGTLHNHRP